MILVILWLSSILMTDTIELFDFKPNSDISDWTVVNDAVMGGRSRGRFSLNDQGHAVFQGEVSLENNGGFSLVRYRFRSIEVAGVKKFAIRLRGDGKRYQFRVQADLNQRYHHVTYFQTSGEWQEVEIPFQDLSPRFRGRDLEGPNYSGERLSEIGLLIGNKRAEAFRLEIDWIRLVE